ncbi:hypothetical protein [Rubrobacter aplysinae]|uniref:hypothetical protein n=1 Tax=Rubrobacter aplysinae TaxID=909625 RepID=UPI00064C1269|nr:hypothetical protein [Rubrobacter aplysinae]
MGEDQKQLGTYSRKFRVMLDIIPHPEGGYWTGTKMKQATGRVVGSSYFVSLRDGAIDIPRADKVEAIAVAMGFPTELWFKDLSWWEDLHRQWESGRPINNELRGSVGNSDRDKRMAVLVNKLFERRLNTDTGQAFTNQEVAARSQRVLSLEDVLALRSGDLADPTWEQLLALSEIFGVGFSYFNGSDTAWIPGAPRPLESEDDQDSYVTFNNSVGLDKESRGLLRGLSDYLKQQKKRTSTDGTEHE